MTIAPINFDLVVSLVFDLPGDIFEKMPGVGFEVLIHINIIALIVTYFAKAIHVELADKRGEVAVLEVYWKNFLCELADTLNCEGVSF